MSQTRVVEMAQVEVHVPQVAAGTTKVTSAWGPIRSGDVLVFVLSVERRGRRDWDLPGSLSPPPVWVYRLLASGPCRSASLAQPLRLGDP